MRPWLKPTVLAATLGVAALIAGSAARTPAAEDVPEQAERVQVGEQAPAFTLPTTEGGSLTLETPRQSSLVLIFFRGAW